MKTPQALPLRDVILQAAISSFVERGYEKASMDEVAARAKTTKRTVYAHFGNKEELFRAALSRAVEWFRGDLPPLTDTRSPAVELETFALAFSQFCTWQRAVRLQRVAIAEAERFPDIGEMMHREVIERCERMVADYLIGMAEARGYTMPGKADDFALSMGSLFLNMTTGPQRIAVLLHAREPHLDHPSRRTGADPDQPRIRQAVSFFLDGLDRLWTTTASAKR